MSLLLASAVGGSAYLQYREARKARKQQERQFQQMLAEYNKPRSDPKPLQQTGGGSVMPVSRSISKKKRAKRGPSKANQGLLSMDTEPSVLGAR